MTANVTPDNKRTSYLYDSSGLLVGVENPLSNRTTLQYDQYYRVNTIINPENERTSYVLDKIGRVESITTPAGTRTTYIRDEMGEPIATINPLGDRTTSVYNNMEELVAVINPLGNRTSYSYDSVGNQIRTTTPSGQITTSIYNSASQVLATINSLGDRTTFSYDAIGNRVTVKNPIGEVTTTLYDQLNRRKVVETPLGSKTTYLYDLNSRLLAQVNPLGDRTSFSYDAAGNQVRTTNPLDAISTVVYDSNSRTVANIDPLGRRSTISYDSAGQRNSTTDPANNISTNLYSPTGRPVVSINPFSERTSFAYDQNGNRIRTTDPLENISTMLYDDDNRPVASVNPLGNRSTTLYNGVGQPIASINPLGDRSTTVYNANGLPIAKINALGNRSTTVYNAAGQTVSSITPLGNRSTSLYDAAGRTIATINPLGDPSVRDPLRRASEDAINDLTEAESIRESLSDRFSHRAFRESASSLATRGTMYSSLFKRWFGGFGAYRAEIAELYSGEVPKGSAVVEDMAMLQKYHRRLSGVQEEADELKPHLPEDFVVNERTSWERLKEALKAFDQLAIAWPEIVVSLPNGRHHILHGKLTEPAHRLLQASQDYEQLVNRTKFELPMLGNEDLASIQQALDDNSTTLTSCRELREKCEELTVRSMLSLTEFDQLITTMSKFSRRQNELNAASEKYAIWLPENSAPTSSSTWLALLNGLEASEQFSISGIDLNKLEDVWCKGTFRLQKDSWSKVGRQLDEASITTQNALQSAGLDPSGFVFKDLVDSIRSTITKLMTQQKHLEAVVSTLCDEENVAVLELADLSHQITDLREAAPVIEKERSKLDELGIHHVSAEQLDAAKWLSQASSDFELDSLSQSIASEETTRAQVRDALNDAKSTFNGNDFEESWCFLKTLFDLDTVVSKGFIISETTLGDLADNLAWLITQMSHFDEWLKFSSWKLDAHQAGFGTVVDELVAKRYEPQDTADVVAVQFYRQLFDKLAEVDRTLGNFDVDEHERIRDRFRFLDQWEVKASSTRIRQYQLGREDRPSSSFLGADSSELGILQKEISKKRKHKPLRRLFAEIPTVLQRLKPCVMMSPLSVSTFLNTDSIRFDLVIFDEASQVFPWDALGAIYRGQQLIVAGDDKQLPPTNFFNRADAESEDDEEDIGDYESILSLCKSIGMPNQRLKWHYRSRREPLIAFSNRHFYDGELVTFPSVYDARGDGVRFEHVPDGRWIDRKNRNEAERVVEMIVNHVQGKPDKSLGIIAFNQSQQRAIEDTLYDLRREHPEVDALFDSGDYFGNVDERLFIKNLENVQGDERDIIILSMGYGFNDAGKFNKNFGPINRQNGERRLNVAVTRAREELILVSSVRAADMDLTTSKSEGAHLLKAYLNYAEKGVDTLGVAMNEFAGEIESPFEEEVAASLIQRGLEPVPQVGCGGFRIDLALKHPQRPGEFCLGVECDGATYHSSNTARDRDRIRQSVLENLGWRIVRIWSTDWIRDPDRQINRVMDEYHAAVTMSPPSYLPFAKDDEEDEFQPEYIEPASTSKPPAQSFGSIDEVPDAVIQSTATYVLTQAGAMNLEDLIKQISRELGFRRLGVKIKARIQSQLNNDLNSGQLNRLGNRVTTAYLD